MLSFCRDLISLRRREPALTSGSYKAIESPKGMWAFRRGRLTVMLNLSDETMHVNAPDSTVVIATLRERDGAKVRDRIELGPWEGVVLA